MKIEPVADFMARRYGIAVDRLPGPSVRMLLEKLDAFSGPAVPEAQGIIQGTCSIGETMFLRHPEQIAALVELLPSLPSSGAGGRLRVWSAGCASGEEAYSLAAALGARAPQVEVIGTDLNAAALERAREARYGFWSLRGVEVAAASDWLSVDAQVGVRAQVSVRDHVKRRVRFERLNLVDDAYPQALDVVFCRNVLLYFTADAAAAVFHAMHAAVRPGGVLFVGPFDHRPAMAGWSEERLGEVGFFRRDPAPTSTPPTPARTVEVFSPDPTPALHLDEPADEGSLPARLAEARSLAGERQVDAALSILQRAAERHPLALAPLVLAAMVADEAGRPAEALAAARRAAFLAPDDALPNFLMGLSLRLVGDRDFALARFHAARRALTRLADPRAPIPQGEGLMPQQLERMIDAHVRAIARH